MIDFIELCKKRQSCRSFDDRMVEHEKLVNCVEAARLAPSGCNSQPWKFLVVETPELVTEVANCTMQLGINSYIANAKAFIIVVEQHATLIPRLRPLFPSQFFAAGDMGAAVVTICYEAEAQGLGSCILGLYDRDRLCELFNLPIDTKFGNIVAIGYPKTPETRNKIRKEFDDIVEFF